MATVMIVVATLAINLFAFVYLVPLLFPATKGYPRAIVAAIIVSMFLMAWAFHEIVVAPCRAKTKPHRVTNNLGQSYTTEYKDSGEWCFWVRGGF